MKGCECGTTKFELYVRLTVMVVVLYLVALQF